MEDYKALKKLGLMQMSRIGNLLFGGNLLTSGVSGEPASDNPHSPGVNLGFYFSQWKRFRQGNAKRTRRPIFTFDATGWVDSGSRAGSRDAGRGSLARAG